MFEHTIAKESFTFDSRFVEPRSFLKARSRIVGEGDKPRATEVRHAIEFCVRKIGRTEECGLREVCIRGECGRVEQPPCMEFGLAEVRQAGKADVRKVRVMREANAMELCGVNEMRAIEFCRLCE